MLTNETNENREMPVKINRTLTKTRRTHLRAICLGCIPVKSKVRTWLC